MAPGLTTCALGKMVDHLPLLHSSRAQGTPVGSFLITDLLYCCQAQNKITLN